MPDILLITMPWDVLRAPSLALGILHALLRENGQDVEVRSLKLRWMEFIIAHAEPSSELPTILDYERVANAESGLGDWVFAEPPMAAEFGLARYTEALAASNESAFVAKMLEMRRLAPAFLDVCAAEILSERPRVVGFTTTFAQNMASLALARRLKNADPNLRVVFGGANCEGSMGVTLQRCFPWIDVIVRGEAEMVAPQLFRALARGDQVEALPGLCYYENGLQVVVPMAQAAAVPMDLVPLPNYDEYFAEAARTSYWATLRSTAFLNFESARGCWWGAVSHCTFCGLNGANMAFRSKSYARVLEDVLTLAERYQVLRLHAVDNILDHRYFADLLPALAASGVDLELGYEVKSNLKYGQIALMHRAGVRYIQPGIESLSTPILALMRKGVTAWQNLRTLKWCAELGITVHWNLLYGFPGEPEDEYRRMGELIPSLVHLDAPRPVPLQVHRFSPYHTRPEAYGLRIVGPSPHLRLLWDVDPSSLAELAYEFDFKHQDGRSPGTYTAECVASVQRWRELRARGASLRFQRGPGFVEIRDQRAGAGAEHLVDLTLEGPEADVYLACDDGARFHAICRRTQLDSERVRSILEDLVAERLVFREGDRYLGLALPSSSRRDAFTDSLSSEGGLIAADTLAVRAHAAR